MKSTFFLSYGPIRPLKIINYTSSECSGTASVCSPETFFKHCPSFFNASTSPSPYTRGDLGKPGVLSSFSVFGVFMIIWIYQNSISLCSHSSVQTFAKKIYTMIIKARWSTTQLSNAFERLKCWIQNYLPSLMLFFLLDSLLEILPNHLVYFRIIVQWNLVSRIFYVHWAFGEIISFRFFVVNVLKVHQ